MVLSAAGKSSAHQSEGQETSVRLGHDSQAQSYFNINGRHYNITTVKRNHVVFLIHRGCRFIEHASNVSQTYLGSVGQWAFDTNWSVDGNWDVC